ncbi:lipase chaperone [Salinisphaera sp. S4-8]
MGTTVDGGVTLDNEGDLVVTRDLRRLFDYFLTGIGRASLPEIRTRLAGHLVVLGLPAPAQAQVLAVYDRYMTYRQRVADMGRTPQADAQALADTLARREALRKEILGLEVADAFFADDDVMARYLVQKRALEQNPNLTENQREQGLAMLEQTLPADIQTARERTNLPARAHAEIAQMREQGASDAEIRERREALLGPQAAQRLEQIDAQRAQWQQRVADYSAERARILANDGLAPDDRERAIEALRQAHFNDAERRRIQSLEHIQAEPAQR